MDALKAFFAYLKTAPPTIQALAAVTLAVALPLAIFGLPQLKTIFHPDAPNPPTPYAKGTARTGQYISQEDKEIHPGPLAAQQAVQEPEATIQQRAGAWHERHNGTHYPEKKYIEQPIGPPDHESFVAYEFYTNDRCLHVLRQINGKPTDKWIADVDAPQHIHEEAALTGRLGPQPDQARQATVETFAPDLANKLLPTVPGVQAAMQDGPQFCLNPHPGTYSWFWGPANGCLQPQYRVFFDGCKHYQVFNACAGVWLPDINWTYCRPH